MQVKAESGLACFNRLVLKFQDEAYTLAWYLFGRERQAAEAVQTAVIRLSRDFPVDETRFRIRLLSLIVHQAKERGLPRTDIGPFRRAGGLHCQALNGPQTLLLLLVSVLGLDYGQAAQVVGCSKRAAAREIAAAYRAVAQETTVHGTGDAGSIGPSALILP